MWFPHTHHFPANMENCFISWFSNISLLILVEKDQFNQDVLSYIYQIYISIWYIDIYIIYILLDSLCQNFGKNICIYVHEKDCCAMSLSSFEFKVISYSKTIGKCVPFVSIPWNNFLRLVLFFFLKYLETFGNIHWWSYMRMFFGFCNNKNNSFCFLCVEGI